jgi:hypothetical protein
MDWYLVGRALGAIAWPIAAAVLVYTIGWLLAAPRAEPEARQILRWVRLAAALAFLATLVLTGSEFLRYARAG